MASLLFRQVGLLLAISLAVVSARANDEVLFIGNSFTQGDTAPAVSKHGGVPKLFEAIAKAKGKQVSTSAVTKGGMGWDYHLAQSATEKALASKVWSWVVLQNHSTRPTTAGNIPQFMADGATFSDRIAVNSPKAGIVLYETWARPAGSFFKTKEAGDLGNPEKMMEQLHKSYGDLGAALAAKNPDRPVRVALVGTAFAASKAAYPDIVLDAKDAHHASAEGYYLAALVIYEAIYKESVKGAPSEFYKGELIIPADQAAKLQEIADKVMAGK